MTMRGTWRDFQMTCSIFMMQKAALRVGRRMTGVTSTPSFSITSGSIDRQGGEPRRAGEQVLGGPYYGGDWYCAIL